MSQTFILRGETKALEYPELSIGQIFYQILKNHPRPNEAAYVDAITKTCISFKDVFERTTKLAAGLTNLGLKKQDIVSIISSNRVDYFIPYLACTYLGVTVNLLNPDYVKRELQHAIELCKPKAIIVSSEKAADAETIQKELSYVKHILNIEELSKYEANASNFTPENSVDVKNDINLILCSSGTTGLPKAVAHTNNNIKYAFLYCDEDKYLGINPKEILIAMLPFYHILGFMIPICGLRFGAKSIVLSKFKPDIFLETIQNYKVSKLVIVPSLAVFLAKNDMTENYDLQRVKDVICGGAPLRVELQALLEQKLGIIVRQAYGLTETTALAISPPDKRYPGSSGSLICNYEAKVVDLESGKPLGPNQPGEFCCKSPTIMKEYLNNTQATKEIFDEEGFLHTGDIGYYCEDGMVYIVDRLKELIKFKGFQVPPAELEDILMTHEEIIDAGVIGVEDERSGELARAFVVRDPNSSITEQQIKEFVAQHVSYQKQLHGGVQFIDSIPKNPSGKILRRELKKLVKF